MSGINTDQDLESPTDDVLDFISSLEHSVDQLDQVLQTNHAYQETQSETETTNRQMNAQITNIFLKQINQNMVIS